MNYLVLGGAGFIGSHVVDALVLRGHNVRVFDRKNANLNNLERSLSSIEIQEGDFYNSTDIVNALVGIDIIVHLISTTIPSTSNYDPVYDADTNITGTVRLLKLAVKASVKKIVFASSGGAVYGEPLVLPIPESHSNNPVCAYGVSKLAIEKYLGLFYHTYGLDYSILRIANPYGERQNPHGGLGAVTTFIWQAIHGETITIWGDGEVARDFFYVSDLVSALITMAEGSPASRIYNIGSGRAYTLREILAAIELVLGELPKVIYAPARTLDVSINYLDITRAKNELGWGPIVTLDQGISKTIDAYKNIP